MRSLGIVSWAKVTAEDVEDRHMTMFGRGFRKMGSYVKFAQVGAVSCFVAGGRPEGRTGVFMGTGLGNTEVAVGLAEGILHAERPWCSPMAFAGSVGNAAPFYVARSLGLDGLIVTISQEELSFEAALLDATLALHDDVVDFALVGGVDVLDPTRLPEHLARLDAEDVAGVATAGSGWLLLGRDPAHAQLDEVWMGQRDALLQNLQGRLLAGWRLQEGERDPRLSPTAQAMRVAEHLEAGERGVATFAHHTRAGLAGRFVVRVP